MDSADRVLLDCMLRCGSALTKSVDQSSVLSSYINVVHLEIVSRLLCTGAREPLPKMRQ